MDILAVQNAKPNGNTLNRIVMSLLIHNFFANSDNILYFVLKPLEHIRSNWDVFWDHDNECYQEEDDSFATELNQLINEIAAIEAPNNYHKHEDRVARYLQSENWMYIWKKGRFWRGSEYKIILEQGSFKDFNQEELILSAAGRVKAAINRQQFHLDEMECSHKYMLCAILSIVLYQRT